jgi:hypothetical protein
LPSGRAGPSGVNVSRWAVRSLSISRMYPGECQVTLVYTYDSDDLDDVRRVREELRLLGVTWKVGYKEDRETVQGHYSSSGKPVSKYWE